MHSITLVTASDARMRKYVAFSAAQAARLGYEILIYDLGGLGIGTSHVVDDPVFLSSGHYGYVKKALGWTSTAVHKPSVIRDALGRLEEASWLVYLDADAAIMRPIPEVVSQYDLGVTVRTESRTVRRYGRINSGVLFLKNIGSVRAFVSQWARLTEERRHDQGPLNAMLHDAMDLTVREFPCHIYNYYNFPTWPAEDVRIVHFKGHARPYFDDFCRRYDFPTYK